MNKIELWTIIILMAIGGCILLYAQHEYFTNLAPTRTEAVVTDGPTFEDLLDAIEWVESKGNPLAVGDNGAAIGCMQIHKIYVDDVNRISKSKRFRGRLFEYDDRLSSYASRQIAAIYLKHYGGTFEEMARKHNGGPQGHKKESTKEYWLKVKARLENSNG